MAKIASSAPEKIVQIKQFKGLHETKDSDTKIGLGEATQCLNFKVTRDGNLKRRPGNRVIARLDSDISSPIMGMWNGWVAGNEYMLCACKGKLYKIYDGSTGSYTPTVLGNIDSSATHVHIFGFDDKAYILDGVKYYYWDGSTFAEVVGYIPLVANAIGPTGTADAAGTLLEQINKLTNKRRCWLSPNGSGTSFKLPETPQAIDSVKKTSDGSTVTGYNLSGSTLTFTSAPAAATNSLEVTYHVNSSFRSEIVGMKFSELYSGASDNRVFLYGDGSNELLYSDIDYDGRARADYFPDMNEVAVGDENSPVTGAIRHFSRLIIYKADSTWTLSSSTLSLADGSLIPSFYVNPINRTIGNEAPGQVQLVLNSPRNLFHNELYEWHSSNAYSGNLTSDERQATRISDRICTTLPLFNFEQAVCYDDNYHQEYYIVNNYTGRALVHNYAVNAWYQYDNLFATGFATVNNTLFWGNIYGEIQCYDESLKSDLWGIDEDPVAIEAYYVTGNMDFGADYARKYSSTLWVGVKPETDSYLEVAVITDRKEQLSEADIKTVSHANNAGFAVWDFNNVSFDNSEQPKMTKLKIKVKKFVFYKMILHVDGLNKRATVLATDIRYRQIGYAK